MVLTFWKFIKLLQALKESHSEIREIQNNYTCMTNHTLFLLATKDLNEVTLLLRQLLTTSQSRSPDTPSCFVGTPDSKRSTRRTTLVLPSTSLGTSFHVTEKTVNNALVFPTRGQLTAGFDFPNFCFFVEAGLCDGELIEPINNLCSFAQLIASDPT